MSIKEKQDRLLTLYWLPKLHKRLYKARFIANSSSCTTTALSKLLTTYLTAVKKHWIRYYDTVYERDGINYVWSIKKSNDVLNKFKFKNFQAFVLVFFSPFSIAIISLGEERANLSAFRTFVRFVLVWICRFPLPLEVWEGLRFVIVALPGLFSYLFFLNCLHMIFSTLYTTLPHHLIKDKLIDLINRTFVRVNTQYLACNEECAYFTSDVHNNHNSWSCQKVCDALVYLLGNIFIRFGTKRYRQTTGIPMGTNCAPLVADLFLFCYERDFMKSLSRENQADIIEAFNSTSRYEYLDDLLNIDNISFDQMVDRIYPT